VPSQFLRVVPASLDDGTELSATARSDMTDLLLEVIDERSGDVGRG
jgi:hypothetical protein